MRDLGVDTEYLIYDREPLRFKYPYAFDVPLETWVELVVANAFYDRAGFTLLGDVFASTTFGPWKRALVKVDKEETFHLRHGENWMKKIAQSAEGRDELQRAIDWMFLLTVEWFGLPDDLKRHSEQLGFGFKGKSNDELRQTWMSTAVPLVQGLGLSVPAHLDADRRHVRPRLPFPGAGSTRKRSRGCSRKGRFPGTKFSCVGSSAGPMNEQYVENLQRGKRGLDRLLARRMIDRPRSRIASGSALRDVEDPEFADQHRRSGTDRGPCASTPDRSAEVDVHRDGLSGDRDDHG